MKAVVAVTIPRQTQLIQIYDIASVTIMAMREDTMAILQSAHIGFVSAPGLRMWYSSCSTISNLLTYCCQVRVPRLKAIIALDIPWRTRSRQKRDKCAVDNRMVEEVRSEAATMLSHTEGQKQNRAEEAGMATRRVHAVNCMYRIIS